MKKRGVLLLAFILFASFLYVGFASAASATQTCNVVSRGACIAANTGGNTAYIVMGLYQTTNSHSTDAAYANGTLGTANYVLCCYNFGGGHTTCSPTTGSNALLNPNYPGSNIPDNKIIGLAAPYNAHADSTGMSTTTDPNYLTPICYNGLECKSTTAGCQAPYSITIFNLSASTNAHVNTLSTISGYDTAICCEIKPALYKVKTYPCTLSSAEWILGDGATASSIYQGSSVFLNLTGDTNCTSSTAINYTITDSNGNVVANWSQPPNGGTFSDHQWTPSSAGKYTFTATALIGSSTKTSSKITVNSLSKVNTCPNYPETQCGDYNNGNFGSNAKTMCSSDPCGANNTDFGLSSLNSTAGFLNSFCAWNSSSNTCDLAGNFGSTKVIPQTTVPSLCNGTSCLNFAGCNNGYTLCYNSTLDSYYCYNNYTCPSGEIPPGQTCGFLSGGCSNIACATGDQDTCASGTTCLTRDNNLGGGGLCSGTVSSPKIFCSNGVCYSNPNELPFTGGCGNGYTLCQINGQNFCYPGSSCSAVPGATAPGTSGQCTSSDSCSSPGCLALTDPKGSCTGNAYCNAGSCYSPNAFLGKCILKTTTSGNCTQGGTLTLHVIATWTGDQSKIPSSCQSGSRKIECPPQIPLPFFNVYNAIITMVVLVLIYSAIVIARKKSKKKGTKKKVSTKPAKKPKTKKTVKASSKKKK